MYKVSANDWDGIGFNKIKGSAKKTKETNRRMKEIAEKYALKGRNNPSPLEKAMIEFLKAHHIEFEFQKPCCIFKDKVITQFFILDFYIPIKKIVIETDGKYHDSQIEYDDYRTKTIKKQYPGTKVIRWRFKDFHSVECMKKLLKQIS